MNRQVQHHVFITIGSTDRNYSFTNLGISYQTSDEGVFEALQPRLVEDTGVDITGSWQEGRYKIRRADNSGNIYIFPNSPAGKYCVL